jgi:hypothetical protein
VRRKVEESDSIVHSVASGVLHTQRLCALQHASWHASHQQRMGASVRLPSALTHSNMHGISRVQAVEGDVRPAITAERDRVDPWRRVVSRGPPNTAVGEEKLPLDLRSKGLHTGDVITPASGAGVCVCVCVCVWVGGWVGVGVGGWVGGCVGVWVCAWDIKRKRD